MVGKGPLPEGAVPSSFQDVMVLKKNNDYFEIKKIAYICKVISVTHIF